MAGPAGRSAEAGETEEVAASVTAALLLEAKRRLPDLPPLPPAHEWALPPPRARPPRAGSWTSGDSKGRGSEGEGRRRKVDSDQSATEARTKWAEAEAWRGGTSQDLSLAGRGSDKAEAEAEAKAAVVRDPALPLRERLEAARGAFHHSLGSPSLGGEGSPASLPGPPARGVEGLSEEAPRHIVEAFEAEKASTRGKVEAQRSSGALSVSEVSQRSLPVLCVRPGSVRPGAFSASSAHAPPLSLSLSLSPLPPLLAARPGLALAFNARSSAPGEARRKA